MVCMETILNKMKNRLILTVIVLLSLTGRAQLTTGLIDCWEFNEASGTVATAYNPANNATIDGATVNQAGKVGKCYDFDATDDLVSIPITTHYTDFSFSAWIYLDSYGEGGNNARLFDKREVDSIQVLGCYVSGITNNNLYFYAIFTTNGQWWTPVNSILTSQWYHVVVTYNSSSTSNDPVIYINGKSQILTEIQTPSGTLTTNLSKYIIGNRGAKDRTWDGLIDQPAIWNKILTQAEVTQLYNSGAGQHFRRKDIHLWTNF